MSIPTFWGADHPLSAKANELYDVLVPMDGNCGSLQGELLRASTRISYDWFNNGWGCNNWSGAVIFIRKFFSELPVQPSEEILAKLKHELSYVIEYSHGERAPRNEERAEEAVTIIHEIIVQGLIDNPDLILNTRDMFDFQERDSDYVDEDDYKYRW
jgi:hypothetical protein